MSAKSKEERAPEAGWYAEQDLEQRDGFGFGFGFGSSSSPVPLTGLTGSEDELQRADEAKQPEQLRRPPLPVTMETASTDKSEISQLKKPIDNMNDPYTSLLSNYSPQLDTSYFSGNAVGEKQKQPTSTDDLISGFECQAAMFSSDSGIEMTPNTELGYGSHKLYDSNKPSESTYNYMDISSREDLHSQEHPLEDWRISAASESSLLPNLKGGLYLEKSPSPVEVETLGPAAAAALDSQAFPYVEEPSDDELSDYQPYRSPGPEGSASPVKITLTETPPSSVSPAGTQRASPVMISEKESILSLGLQGVPTVTLSEPEDDSPDSSTPPLTEESDSPSDPMIQTTEKKTVCSTHEGAPEAAALYSQTTTRPQNPGIENISPTLPPYAKVADASSGESGDSEIELVSEESSPQAPSSAYMSLSKTRSSPLPTTQASSTTSVPVSSPPSIHTSAAVLSQTSEPAPNLAMQYSILREEREAELDSELALESCEEESPKRFFQDAIPKAKNVDSPLAEPPKPSAPPVPTLKPTPQQVPAVPKDVPKEKIQSERVEEQPKPSSKPVVSSGVVPELKVEQSSEESHRDNRDSDTARQSTAPPIFQGISREKAMELLYWRDVKQTGLVFSSVLLLLFSLTQFSVVSVVAYLALAALSATISFRVYKSVLQAVQKTDEGHPFKSYLEVEMSLSHDQMQRYAEKTQFYINSTLKELRRLFLVQDLVDSLKFAVLMWLLTYVGALFNGLTLMIMAVVSMFSMPVVYEKYQAQIDQYLGLIRTQVNQVVGKIQEKIPGAKRKPE